MHTTPARTCNGAKSSSLTNNHSNAEKYRVKPVYIKGLLTFTLESVNNTAHTLGGTHFFVAGWDLLAPCATSAPVISSHADISRQTCYAMVHTAKHSKSTATCTQVHSREQALATLFLSVSCGRAHHWLHYQHHTALSQPVSEKTSLPGLLASDHSRKPPRQHKPRQSLECFSLLHPCIVRLKQPGPRCCLARRLRQYLCKPRPRVAISQQATPPLLGAKK